jgi:adenosylcobinamide-phosphate synthase
MRLEYQILAAFFLDILVGDPRWFPHPVKIMGRLALRLENVSRKLIRPRLAGLITALTVIGLSAGLTYSALRAVTYLHPVGGDVLGIIIIYTTISVRDLYGHGMAVYRALSSGDLELAREKVAMMVGRDTDKMNESEVVRGTVESVAENIVDGVTGPLFFAVLAGPVGAMAYRAINTLDSTFGYRNERYIEFGWASARIDDVANFIPARLTAFAIVVASVLFGLHPLRSLRIIFRDSRKHESPNSGFPESAVAGALGVRLGGINYQNGTSEENPFIGDPEVSLTPRHIVSANRLMIGSSLIILLASLGARISLLYFGGP